MPARSQYDADFYAWANEQAALLRAGKLDQADIANIAEEIESMGRTEKREMINRLAVLMLHLIKWRFQPALQSHSWRYSIREQRQRLSDHLDDNPSLRSNLDECMRKAYRLAALDAVRETGLPEEVFPTDCPWDFETVSDPAFWPEAN